MPTAVIWSKPKTDLEFQYGGRLANSVACHPSAACHIAGLLPPGEFSVMIPELRVTLQLRMLPPGELNDMSSHSFHFLESCSVD